MDKFSYEAVMGAAKIAFLWNSVEGSYENFRREMSDLLLDMPENKLLELARRVGNDSAINVPVQV